MYSESESSNSAFRQNRQAEAAAHTPQYDWLEIFLRSDIAAGTL